MRGWIVAIAVTFVLGVWVGHVGIRPPASSFHPIVELHARQTPLRDSLRVDTLRLTKWLTKRDTLLVADTVPIWDTVWVKEYIETTDSTIFACKKALGSCLTLLENRDSVVAAQTAYIEKAEPRDNRWLRLGERIFFTTAGFGACQLTR